MNEITERIQDEQSLNIFKVSSESSMDAVYWFTSNGEFLYVNKSACEMLEYSKDELLSMRVFDIDPVYTEATWKHNWEKFRKDRKERKLHLETIHKTKNGKLLNIDVVTTYIEINGTEYQIAHGRDITERILTEEAVRQSEEKYRLLFENIPSGFSLHEMIYDNKGEPVDYRFIEMNPAYEKSLSVRASDMVGKTLTEIGAESDLYLIQLFGNVVETGIPEHSSYYNEHTKKHFEYFVFRPQKGQVCCCLE